jgi:DNA polymerase-3 subunit alpha
LHQQEKELIGINLSYHPFAQYSSLVETKKLSTVSDVLNQAGGIVQFVGMLGKIKKIKTKAGEEMAFLEMEDEFNSVEGVLFSGDFRRFGSMLEKGKVYLVKGNQEQRNNKWQVVINAIQPL